MDTTLALTDEIDSTCRELQVRLPPDANVMTDGGMVWWLEIFNKDTKLRLHAFLFYYSSTPKGNVIFVVISIFILGYLLTVHETCPASFATTL